jgi:glucans biosynthesis protein C
MVAREAAPVNAPQSPPSAPERYHALDFVRGVLMLLGLIYHAALIYDSSTFQGFEKPYPTSELLRFIAQSSHAFRMPLFFVLAGFFAALLLSRRSTSGFIRNRGARIGVPLVIGWMVLGPLMASGTAFFGLSHFFTHRLALEYAWRMLKSFDYFLKDNSMHLWFLYYLLMCYVAFLLIGWLARSVHISHFTRVNAKINGALFSRWRLLALALPTFALLYVGPAADDSNPFSFAPEWRWALYFGALFAAGVLLFNAKETIRDVGRIAWLYLMLAFASMFVLDLARDHLREGASFETGWRAVSNAAVAVMIWSLFFGSTSLLLRYLNRPIAGVRYVADASYWSYLVHTIPLIWLPGLIAREAWAPEIKYLMVLLVTTFICFVTYDLFVRWTYLGTVLQGRRHRSMLGAFFGSLIASRRSRTLS